jgi:TetR/AcrR family transcriptional repressor of lmrAB and yxaGH operons
MPAVKVFPGDVDRKLMKVFSRYGYDGASMELLSEATGLKKASLYHRFPGGKKDMAAHVLKNVEAWFQTNFQLVIADKSVPLPERLEQALAGVSTLFEDGTQNCSLRMLSACSETPYFQETITSCFNIISNGFSQAAMESGMEEALARQKATEAIINIQGSLVLSRAMNDNQIFLKSISGIPALLGVLKK